MQPRIYIRRPSPSDETEFLAAARRSRTLHHPWTTPPTASAGFRAYIDRMERPENEGFLVCRRDTDAIAGAVEITNIVLGRFCSGYLSYYAFTRHERQGFMREGLLLVIGEAFNRLGLHRLEANIQPGNTASIALAKSCGFSKEGYSPRYLRIGDRWRDHERWALVAESHGPRQPLRG